MQSGGSIPGTSRLQMHDARQSRLFLAYICLPIVNVEGNRCVSSSCGQPNARARLATSCGMKRAIRETRFDSKCTCILVAKYCDASTTQTPLLSDDGWEMFGLPEPSCSLFDLVLIADQVVAHVVRCISTALDLSNLFTSLHKC